MTWQGGGGYGDPLTRDPDAVARDLREQKITEAAAAAVYGVVLADGLVDTVATARERERQRAGRRERSRVLGTTRGKADLTAARRVDDNLVEVPGQSSGTLVACRHCAEVLGGTGPDDELALAVYEGPSVEAGPQIIATRPTTSTHPSCSGSTAARPAGRRCTAPSSPPITWTRLPRSAG